MSRSNPHCVRAIPAFQSFLILLSNGFLFPKDLSQELQLDLDVFLKRITIVDAKVTDPSDNVESLGLQGAMEGLQLSSSRGRRVVFTHDHEKRPWTDSIDEIVGLE